MYKNNEDINDETKENINNSNYNNENASTLNSASASDLNNTSSDDTNDVSKIRSKKFRNFDLEHYEQTTVAVKLGIKLSCLYALVLFIIFVIYFCVYLAHIKSSVTLVTNNIDSYIKTQLEEAENVIGEYHNVILNNGNTFDNIKESYRDILKRTLLCRTNIDSINVLFENGILYSLDSNTKTIANDDSGIYTSIKSMTTADSEVIVNNEYIYEKELQGYYRMFGTKVRDSNTNNLLGVIAFDVDPADLIERILDELPKLNKLGMYVVDSSNTLIYRNTAISRGVRDALSEMQRMAAGKNMDANAKKMFEIARKNLRAEENQSENILKQIKQRNEETETEQIEQDVPKTSSEIEAQEEVAEENTANKSEIKVIENGYDIYDVSIEYYDNLSILIFNVINEIFSINKMPAYIVVKDADIQLRFIAEYSTLIVNDIKMIVGTTILFATIMVLIIYSLSFAFQFNKKSAKQMLKYTIISIVLMIVCYNLQEMKILDDYKNDEVISDGILINNNTKDALNFYNMTLYNMKSKIDAKEELNLANNLRQTDRDERYNEIASEYNAILERDIKNALEAENLKNVSVKIADQGLDGKYSVLSGNENITNTNADLDSNTDSNTDSNIDINADGNTDNDTEISIYGLLSDDYYSKEYYEKVLESIDTKDTYIESKLSDDEKYITIRQVRKIEYQGMTTLLDITCSFDINRLELEKCSEAEKRFGKKIRVDIAGESYYFEDDKVTRINADAEEEKEKEKEKEEALVNVNTNSLSEDIVVISNLGNKKLIVKDAEFDINYTIEYKAQFDTANFFGIILSILIIYGLYKVMINDIENNEEEKEEKRKGIFEDVTIIKAKDLDDRLMVDISKVNLKEDENHEASLEHYERRSQRERIIKENIDNDKRQESENQIKPIFKIGRTYYDEIKSFKNKDKEAKENKEANLTGLSILDNDEEMYQKYVYDTEKAKKEAEKEMKKKKAKRKKEGIDYEEEEQEEYDITIKMDNKDEFEEDNSTEFKKKERKLLLTSKDEEFGKMLIEKYRKNNKNE